MPGLCIDDASGVHSAGRAGLDVRKRAQHMRDVEDNHAHEGAISADAETDAAARSLCNAAAASQGSGLIAARGRISKQTSTDGRFQLVTAIVQLLLDRQQRQQGVAASDDAARAATEAVAQALEVQEQIGSAATARPESAPASCRNTAEQRPHRPSTGSATQQLPPAQSSPDGAAAHAAQPRWRGAPRERSNAAILALAHTLIAAHASPHLRDSDAQFPWSKKPPVPKMRRRPRRRPSAEGGLDSAASSCSEPGFDGAGGYGRRAPPPPRLPPESKRPAWAQLVNAAPAEQEQALLDWVSQVNSAPAE